MSRIISEETKSEALRLLGDRYSLNEVSEALGVSVSTLWKWRGGKGTKRPKLKIDIDAAKLNKQDAEIGIPAALNPALTSHESIGFLSKYDLDMFLAAGVKNLNYRIAEEKLRKLTLENDANERRHGVAVPSTPSRQIDPEKAKAADDALIIIVRPSFMEQWTAAYEGRAYAGDASDSVDVDMAAVKIGRTGSSMNAVSELIDEDGRIAELLMVNEVGGIAKQRISFETIERSIQNMNRPDSFKFVDQLMDQNPLINDWPDAMAKYVESIESFDRQHDIREAKKKEAMSAACMVAHANQRSRMERRQDAVISLIESGDINTTSDARLDILTPEQIGGAVERQLRKRLYKENASNNTDNGPSHSATY